MIFEKIIKLIIFVFQYLNVMKKFYGNINDKNFPLFLYLECMYM